MTIAVIGYGSQGRAAALNLRDSGFDVTVALRPRSKSRTRARREKITHIKSIPEAVAASEVIIFGFPDHLHGRVYRDKIRAHLTAGSTLVFLHGLSVHFGAVEPPPDADVILIAPHGPGVAVREKYLSGDRTMSAFEAVYQNRSRQARRTLHALAKGLGFDRKRLIKTTFAEEAIGDMFGEQAVLCGGMAALIKSGFDVLVENGISPDNAYLEVAYQLDLIVALIKQYGITGMFDRISLTARYGSLVTGPELIDQSVKKRMQRAFARIESGRFVKELEKLDERGIVELRRTLQALTDPRLEKAAKKFAK